MGKMIPYVVKAGAIAAVGLLLPAILFAQDTRTAARGAPATVLSSDAAAVVFRVDLRPWTVQPSTRLEGTETVRVPGFFNQGQPGQPAVPVRKFLVGLPPAGSWTVSWRVIDSAPLGSRRLTPAPYPEARNGGDLGPVAAERYQIDPAVYNAYRSGPPVLEEEPAWIRRQRVLPLWVEPLTYDPVSGATALATSIEITVRFGGGSRVAGRPAPETAEWEDTFSRLLVNAAQARGWRRPSRTRDFSFERAEGALPQGPLVKLRVKKTGVHKVSAGALISAGFPAARSVDDLVLFRRDYDEDGLTGTTANVGFEVSEDPSGTPGVFDGNDVLIFYGLRPRDDSARNDPRELNTGHNVYWLGSGPGTSMPDRTLAPGYLTADTAATWFPKTELFAEDTFFRENTPQGRTDYYFCNSPVDKIIDFPFELDTVRPGTSLSLTAELHGGYRGWLGSVTTRLVNSAGNIVLDYGFPVPDISVREYQADIPAADLVPGTNTFRFYNFNNPDDLVQVLLNWLRVSYEADYRAHGDVLDFNTGALTGDTSVTVTGLGDTDVWLFDITDPSAPVNCVTAPAMFTEVGGSYAFTFRDNIVSQKRYVLTPVRRMIEIGAEDIALDQPSTIIGDPAESGVDVLVVTHADFRTLMADWVRYRRAQGYRVLMVDVEDVYDEFNGGVPGTQGIDRFVRHFFELGNAGYLVLVGDGSEDHKQMCAASAPDFIPSHTRTEYIQPPWNTDEVVTLDKEFVKLPGPGGTVDGYPDLAVGRLPVGRDSELQIVLNKIAAFERPKASDFWRRRMLIIADDAWSGGIQNTCFEKAELEFEAGQDSTARVIERQYPGMFDVVRFYLSEYTKNFHAPLPDPLPNRLCENGLMYALRTYTRDNITPLVLNELSQGATLVTFQAHMNRSLLTHEMLLTTSRAVAGGGVGKDHQRINNRDKPFLIFGMGCHFSDYAVSCELAEDADNSPNGDCFAEQLLFQNEEGAVGTYGSSGFEYLFQVNQFMYVMSGVWFYDAPYDDLITQTGGRWIFGQLMFLTESAAVGRGQLLPVSRYHILGDPLLRIESGPPLMEVTVNGRPISSGENVISSTDTILVNASVRDENVIEKFELIVDGTDASNTLTVTPVGDESIPRSRQYEVSFTHVLQLKEYDIVLRALQAPDTEGGYHMAAKFILKIPSGFDLSVDGRRIFDGDLVPARGGYTVDLSFPVFVPSSLIGVRIDDTPVSGLTFSHPSEQDTTSWLVRFSKSLAEGRHDLVVTVDGTDLSPRTLVVSSVAGLRDVLNYPNPFDEVTQFVYSTDVEIDQGTIEVFTTSGRKVRRMEIPPDARTPGQNAVFWDGRDDAGDEVANGVYLYTIRVKQRGQTSVARGKLVRMR